MKSLSVSSRARKYRELHHISEGLGTAIVVQVCFSRAQNYFRTLQSMVFGNISSDSCVGKICTRNPDTGVNSIYGSYPRKSIAKFIFYSGEYSCCVEGDDISDSLDENANNIEVLCFRRYIFRHFRSKELQLYLPNVFSELKRIAGVIENFFGDCQVSNRFFWRFICVGHRVYRSSRRAIYSRNNSSTKISSSK